MFSIHAIAISQKFPPSLSVIRGAAAVSRVTCDGSGDDYKRRNYFVTCSCWRNVALLHAGKILRRLNRSKLLLLATELLIAQ